MLSFVNYIELALLLVTAMCIYSATQLLIVIINKKIDPYVYDTTGYCTNYSV